MSHLTNKSWFPVFTALLCAFGALGLAAAPAGAATQFTTLYNFSAQTSGGVYDNTDGESPRASLLQGSDGDFYGTTNYGGSLNFGTVFKLTPTGTLTTLHDFSGGPGGATPYDSLIQGSDGNFYGTTYDQGEGNGSSPETYGTVFKLTPAGAFTTLHTFSGSGDGGGSFGALVQGHDDNFYGTTQYGGANGSGTIFKITPTGTLTVLYSFSPLNGENPDGAEPYAGLVQGSDGDFYGTTREGGSNGYGTIFKITSAGAYTTLYTFSTLTYNGDDNGTNSDGANPESPLIQGSDGNFYGTTYYGGTGGSGVAFKITPSGTLTTLHSLAPDDAGINSDGEFPVAGLTQGNDGNFYGTASVGGTNYNGTLFQITSAGTFTLLYTFSASTDNKNSDGQSPIAGLIQGSDGSFYGATAGGGTNGYGTLFKIAVTPTAPPTITSIAPNAGPVGSTVVITGTNFTGVTRVRFHNASATTYSVNAAGTQLTVTVPSGAGTGTITVNEPGFSVTSSQTFTVLAQPTITSIAPTAGPVGSTVTITGTNFSDVTRVRFHNATATTYSVNGAGTQITVTVPSGAGTGTITVNEPGITVTSSQTFTVLAQPTITSISPTSGPMGTVVTITGTHFADVTRVRFHNASATSYSVNAAETQITVTVPGGAGTGTITVNEPGITVTSSQTFTITP